MVRPKSSAPCNRIFLTNLIRTSLEAGATYFLTVIFMTEDLPFRRKKMFAKLSAEVRIQERMRKLEITSDFLATLALIPASRLSLAFRGLKSLSNGDAELLFGVLSDLEALAERARPFPIAFRNPVLIRDLIKECNGDNTMVAAQ
jgi:hypothetical protein